MRDRQPAPLQAGRPRKEDESEVRSAIVRFLIIGLAAFLVVITPVAFYILGQAERHALDSARGSTQRLADFAVGPAVTDELLARDEAALAALDRRLGPWLRNGPAQRIKVWDASGVIVYSDVRELIGQRYQLDGVAEDLLSGGPGTATIERQAQLENAFEVDSGELVEVYVKSESATGEPLIFEAYYTDSIVRGEQAKVLWDMAPAVVVALAVLQLAQLVPAIALARRMQAGHAARRRLLHRSIEASDLERRRIARSLHDEVIQDLAGLSYAMEAEQMRSTPEQRALFTQAHSILQDNVRTLRGMTKELYPSNLETLGLPAALHRLADPLREAGIQVTLRGAEIDTLPMDVSVMLYRVAREAVGNILKHACAGSVELVLDAESGETVLRIRDDGRGFDYGSSAPDGHIGLRIIRDTIEDAGGRLDVSSAPGVGTLVEARLATRGYP